MNKDFFKNVIKNNLLITILLVASIILTVVTSIMPPLVLEKAVNLLVEKKAISLSLTVSYFAMLVISGVFESLREALITVFGEKVLHELRSLLTRKIARLKTEYITGHDTGEITSLFVNDVDTIETLFNAGIISMLADACTLISIIIVVFTRSLGLGILLCLSTPVFFKLTRYFQKSMLSAQKDNRKAISEAAKIIPETLNNKTTIYNLDAEKFMEERYDKSIMKSYKSLEKVNFYDSIYSPIIILVSTLIIAMMMYLSSLGGIYKTMFGMSVGTATALISYVNQVFSPLESIGMEIQNIQSAIAGITRINEFLNEDELISVDEKISVDYLSKPVEINNLSFGYNPDKLIINNFNLSVNNYDSITITGRTGAGKSTLFKLILGLYKAQGGSVKVFGIDSYKIRNEDKRKVYGCVEQGFKATIGSIKDQITLKDPTISEEEINKALEIVNLSHLKDHLDDKFNEKEYSQGELQLFSIARAIVKNPKILLLDEMSANLDALTEQMIMEVLVKASHDKTVLSISHRKYTIKNTKEISLTNL